MVRNYVTAFIKSFYKRNDMPMLELTPNFIKEFAAYLTAERGLKSVCTIPYQPECEGAHRMRTNTPCVEDRMTYFLPSMCIIS